MGSVFPHGLRLEQSSLLPKVEFQRINVDGERTTHFQTQESAVEENHLCSMLADP